jgi:hypothetical protein
MKGTAVRITLSILVFSGIVTRMNLPNQNPSTASKTETTINTKGGRIL